MQGKREVVKGDSRAVSPVLAAMKVAAGCPAGVPSAYGAAPKQPASEESLWPCFWPL